MRGGGAGWSLYYLLMHLHRRHIAPFVVAPARGIFDRTYAELGVAVVEPSGP